MTQRQMPPAAMLLLADGRFPAGGHTHSGGMEVAVADGRVFDTESLSAFLAGRVRTQGLVQAALAAAACDTDAAVHAELDTHANARHPAAVQRRVSRAQGRALLRAGRACWPSAALDALALTPGGPHQAIALGAVSAAAGVRPAEAALISTLGAVQGPATAAVRLLGLDPYAVHRVLADLAGVCEDVADAAAAAATGSFWDLPADTAPRLDIDAVRHEQWEVRLFAS